MKLDYIQDLWFGYKMKNRKQKCLGCPLYELWNNEYDERWNDVGDKK